MFNTTSSSAPQGIRAGFLFLGCKFYESRLLSHCDSRLFRNVKDVYLKPHLDISQQISLLKSRGLKISDSQKAEDILSRIGYYRVAGYARPLNEFRIETLPNGKLQHIPLETFKTGARLSDVVDLYVFDKRLRLLILDAIERVEVALRVDIGHHIGGIDPFFHRSPHRVFHRFARIDGASRRSKHEEWLTKHDAAFDRSKESLLEDFRAKYQMPAPLWIAVEAWDFGTLSLFASFFKTEDANLFASRFAIPNGELIKNWLRSINYVRNICAHHGRLWNKQLVNWPKPPNAQELPAMAHLANDSFAQRRIYAVVCVLRWLLLQVNPSSTWHKRMGVHLGTFPKSGLLRLSDTGFPSNWANLPLWR